MTSPQESSNSPPERTTERALRWLKHAFATTSEADQVEPTPVQLAVVERLCHAIVSRRMAAPALLFLESLKPLNYVSAQVLHFFAPFAATLGDSHAYGEFAQFLERRDAIERIYQRIEQLDRARAEQN